MFVSLLTDQEGVADLTEHAVRAWRQAAAQWVGRRIVLFDEAAVVLTRAVCDWSGLALSDKQTHQLARDCVAMVDGFATPGPRHWRARAARSRQERAMARLFERPQETGARASTALAIVADQQDAEGRRLDPHTAAVERQRLQEDGSEHFATAFAHETRRYYPFAPFVGGLAARDLLWHGHRIPRGAMVLLDLYGQDHDPALWADPYRFNPDRFLCRPPRPDELIPQGGGDARAGHRCPGEDITTVLLATLAKELAALEYTVVDQDLSIPLNRMPTRPRSGFVMCPQRQTMVLTRGANRP
ncbi:cytochrome P450 [Streptomyces wuyuanensis]|uniref:cytochrome P450 n=1 Tax=Streptomyces wuyuanensis TaxID=1196353 RepID=UPI003724ABB1